MRKMKRNDETKATVKPVSNIGLTNIDLLII